MVKNSLMFVVTSQSGAAYTRGQGRCWKATGNSNRFSQSWNRSDMVTESPKYCWRSAAHFRPKMV